MTEFKIDPTKYVGLEPEEARRRITEDERRAINADPGLQAHIRDMDRRQAQAEVEEQRAAVQLEKEREKKFAEDLNARYRDRLQFYRFKGVPEKVFDEEIWPMLRYEYMMGGEDAVDQDRARQSAPIF